MPLLFPANESEKNTLVKWTGQQLGILDYGAAIGSCSAIGVYHHSKIVAVALFHEFRLPSIQITFVTSSPRWASPSAVKTIIAYPFKQLGCKRITAITGAKNQPARAFLCRLGFKEEGFHPDFLPTGDAVSYGLLRKGAARWLEEKSLEQTIGPNPSGPRGDSGSANNVEC